MKVVYWARDLRSGPLFHALKTHCKGDVLDVGGGDFFFTAENMKVPFDKWTTLEVSPERALKSVDPRFEMVFGDGCKMDFKDESFDLVLNLQVVEHVFEPLKMVQEIARVLKPGGTAIFLIPQTSNIHLLPHHYYNFTIFWIREAMKRSGLEIAEIKALGGAWSTIASRMVYAIVQGLGAKGFTYGHKRPLAFYLLAPFMLLYILVSVPICMIFSLGDIEEEPNNHLVVVRK